MWFQDPLRTHRASPKAAVDVRPDDLCSDSLERRNDRHAEGGRRTSPPLCRRRRQLHEWTKSALNQWTDTIMLPLPLFPRTQMCAAARFVAGAPLSIVPNPRDLDDLLETVRQVKPAFFNGIPTLYTAILNHP